MRENFGGLMEPVRNERGSVIVFVTLMIVILLIMVGLGLDTGQLTYVRNQGQAAVDAAALAAVSALPSRDDDQIKSRAAGYNSTNNYVESPTNKIGSSNVSYVQYDYTTNAISNYSASVTTANGVRVALEGGSSITTPVFLTPLLNLLGIATASTQNVSVSAVATIAGKPSIPIAVWSTVCNGSTPVPDVELKQQHPGQENSCWTTYSDKSSGTPDIKALFAASETCQGLPGSQSGTPITIGTPIYQNDGGAVSVYTAAEDFFFKNSATKNRCWLLPVLNGGGNCALKDPTPIVDWASFCPESMLKHGGHSYFKGTLTCKAKPDQLENSLCFSHRLVREPTKGY
jgi:Flp pilus assembly protein TadG